MSYTLSSDKHCSTLMSALNKFRETKKFHDVCFLADSERLYVNRTILAAYSPYMEHVLNDLNNTTVVFVAHGISAKTMNQLIDFMYRGVISIAQEDVMPLINAAKIYHIVGLKDCANSEGSLGKASHQGQFNCTTPLHPRHLHTQTYIDPPLQKIPPSSLTASQLFSHCPAQVVSSQPLEQTGSASTCCSHICASARVTITSKPAAPPSTSFARDIVLGSGISITPTSVEPATSSSGLFQCSPNSHLHQQHIGSLAKTFPPPVSDISRQNHGDAESSAIVEPMAASSSSVPTDHLPSQSATVLLSASQVTTSCSSAPATTTQSVSSASSTTSQSISNRPHSKDSENCESPSVRVSIHRKRSRSPHKIQICQTSPAPSERNDNSVAPNTQASDLTIELEELGTNIKKNSSSSSEGEDIINEVLALADSVLPAASTPLVKRTSPRRTGLSGPFARRSHSFRYPGIQRNVSPLGGSSKPSNNQLPAEATSPKSKVIVREQYRGVHRPPGRRRGKPR
ncbi:Longitudinals lacking protein, isoforms F/I/K/T [Gryllus bimaculatus]|nr:Longitudinals lacking protein, isoforms F/I/K/T [Gryllus bimaculatus]